MVYIEARTIGNKKYYYLVVNTRVGKNKWRKERKYMGTRKPSAEDIASFLKKVENVLTNPAKYLSQDQVKILAKLKLGYQKYLGKLTSQDFIKFEDATITSFTYNTNAIEGSTLSLQDTGLILHDHITPSGKDLREVYGAINMREGYRYLKNMRDITGQTIKKIHSIIMKNILEVEVGDYRTVPVRIIGSRVQPPFPIDIEEEMTALVQWYTQNKDLHPFELACLLHIKFEKIHPFRDGNGRVGRLLMNFVLLKHNYPLLDITVDKKLDYYKTLESAQMQRKYKDFIEYSFSIYTEDAESMGWV